MSPEKNLIICLARTRLDEKLVHQVRELVRAGVDWEALFTDLQSNGVQHLAFTSLKKCCPELIPEDVNARFRREIQEAGAFNLAMSAKLERLHVLFRKHDILLIPFKGPLLAYAVYGNVALRVFSDLDVLVRSTEVVRASELLREAGYVAEIDLAPAQLARLVKTEDNLSFVHAELGFVVEMHWELSGNYLPRPLDVETILPRVIEEEFFKAVVPSLGNEDLLIYLCVHGCKHIWQRLEWVCCVNELISSRSLDWKLVLELAKQWSARRMVAIGVLISESLFGTPVPEEVLRALRSDAGAGKMASSIIAVYRDGAAAKNDESGETRFSLWQFQCADSAAGVVRLAVAMLFSPTVEDWRQNPLPARLSFLYYLLRPLRLLRQLAKKQKQQKGDGFI